MSGTSQDGVDAVVLDCGTGRPPKIIAHHAGAYPPALRRDLLALAASTQPVPLKAFAALDDAVAQAFAGTAIAALRKAKIPARRVRALGSHGQTVFHDPLKAGNSLQIGNPSRIAALTGIDTVADFRRADIAAGGQGAPLVPAFHKVVFGSSGESRAVVNLGGIANITVLPTRGAVTGFDTGPGNALLDEWIAAHLKQAFDRGGRWGRSGQLNPKLLQALLADPWLQRAPPKSTGRDHFNLAWLRRRFPSLGRLKPADVQRTLTEFTARTVAMALARHAPKVGRVLVCGGGVRNAFLMSRLAALTSVPVDSTQTQGIHPQCVEAAAFAWLAFRAVERRPGNLPSVTGASRPVVLGGIYPAS